MYEPFTQDLGREHYRELLRERRNVNIAKGRRELRRSLRSLLSGMIDKLSHGFAYLTSRHQIRPISGDSGG